jgi:hypothetical protein
LDKKAKGFFIQMPAKLVLIIAIYQAKRNNEYPFPSRIQCRGVSPVALPRLPVNLSLPAAFVYEAVS